MLGDYKMLVTFSLKYANAASFQASLINVGPKPYDWGFRFFGFKSFFLALKPDLKTNLQFLTLKIEEKVQNSLS